MITVKYLSKGNEKTPPQEMNKTRKSGYGLYVVGKDKMLRDKAELIREVPEEMKV